MVVVCGDGIGGRECNVVMNVLMVVILVIVSDVKYLISYFQTPLCFTYTISIFF